MEATQSPGACKTEITICFGNCTLILKALLHIAFLGFGWDFLLISSNFPEHFAPFFPKKCVLLGPEVICCQPGIVNLQQEVGIFNCGHQHLGSER